MEQEIKSTGHKSLVGFYIDDSIQWVSGNEYLRYCQHFDNVFRKLFPYNCTQLYWKNILIVGGGDMQLKSGTYMLSTDCRTKIIDPNIHKYQEILVESKDKVPEFIFNKQRDCYNNPRFTDYLTYTIQEFLEEEKYINLFLNGDMKARDKLIEHNLRLVVFLAKKYENTKIDLEDLVSIGTIGLIKGVNTYGSKTTGIW